MFCVADSGLHHDLVVPGSRLEVLLVSSNGRDPTSVAEHVQLYVRRRGSIGLGWIMETREGDLFLGYGIEAGAYDLVIHGGGEFEPEEDRISFEIAPDRPFRRVTVLGAVR